MVDKIPMNDLKTQVESILTLHGLPSAKNLYDKIIKAITENGIDGFYKFEEEIAPKKYKPILNSLKDLHTKTEIIQNKNESIYDINNFIEHYLDTFEINNDDDELQSKIKEFFVEKMLESFQEFKNQIDFVKLQKALLIKKEKIESNNFNSTSITNFLKLFLVEFKITTDEDLILKMIKNALDCLKAVKINFKDDISPKIMNELVSSIDLEIDKIATIDQKKDKKKIFVKKKKKKKKLNRIQRIKKSY